MTHSWLSTRQAAAYCACHIETIRKAARAGCLRSSRRGRRGHLYFRRADLDVWLGRAEQAEEVR